MLLFRPKVVTTEISHADLDRAKDSEILRLRSLVNALRRNGGKDIIDSSSSVVLRDIRFNDVSDDPIQNSFVINRANERIKRMIAKSRQDDQKDLEIESLRRMVSRSTINLELAKDWVDGKVYELEQILLKKEAELDRLKKQELRILEERKLGIQHIVPPKKVNNNSNSHVVATVKNDVNLYIGEEHQKLKDEIEKIQQQNLVLSCNLEEEQKYLNAEYLDLAERQEVLADMYKDAAKKREMVSVQEELKSSQKALEERQKVVQLLADALELERKAVEATQRECQLLQEEASQVTQIVTELQSKKEERNMMISLADGTQLGKYNWKNGELVARWVSLSSDGKKLLYGPVSAAKSDRSNFSFLNLAEVTGAGIGLATNARRLLKPYPTNPNCVFYLTTNQRDYLFMANSASVAAAWVRTLCPFLPKIVGDAVRERSVVETPVLTPTSPLSPRIRSLTSLQPNASTVSWKPRPRTTTEF